MKFAIMTLLLILCGNLYSFCDLDFYLKVLLTAKQGLLSQAVDSNILKDEAKDYYRSAIEIPDLVEFLIKVEDEEKKIIEQNSLCELFSGDINLEDEFIPAAIDSLIRFNFDHLSDNPKDITLRFWGGYRDQNIMFEKYYRPIPNQRKVGRFFGFDLLVKIKGE